MTIGYTAGVQSSNDMDRHALGSARLNIGTIWTTLILFISAFVGCWVFSIESRANQARPHSRSATRMRL